MMQVGYRLPRHEMLIDNILEQFDNIDLFEWQAMLLLPQPS